MKDDIFLDYKIAVTIPYYNASKQITKVVSKLPNYIHSCIIIDDQSKEELPKKEI